MKWEWPERFRWTWRGFLAMWAAFSVGAFMVTWMGYGNCAWPRCWGDPISFGQALDRGPRILLLFPLTFVVVVVLSGIRSDGPRQKED